MSTPDPMTDADLLSDEFELLKPHKCAAKSKRTGVQCGQWAPPGFVTCMWHGAKAPQVREAAEKRLMNLVTPAIAVFERLMDSDDPKLAATAFSAAKDVMDRAGFAPVKKFEGELNVTSDVVYLLDEYDRQQAALEGHRLGVADTLEAQAEKETAE